MARFRKRACLFGGRTNDAEDAVARGDFGQVVLLDGSERPCRSRVAGEDHERTSAVKKSLDRFERVTINGFKGAGTVWGASVIAQVRKVLFRKRLAQFVKNRETAKSRIEDSDHVYLRMRDCTLRIESLANSPGKSSPGEVRRSS